LAQSFHRSKPVRALSGPSQLGGAKLKAILWTALLAFGVYAAYKLIPVYIANYQLSDKMVEESRFAVANRFTEDQVREIIYKEIVDLEIPAKKEDIKVAASLQAVRISLDYNVPVDLLFYHMQLHFNPSSEGKALWTP
jgi:hypothetical protein